MQPRISRVPVTGEDVMTYIVLALGLLMAIIGFGAVLSGYPIIEVERGWATVISGTVLLSAGLVTVALGLVGRILVDLVKVTRATRASIQPAGDASAHPAGDAFAQPASGAFAPADAVLAPVQARPPAPRVELPRVEPTAAFAVAAPLAAAAAVAAHETQHETPVAAPEPIPESAHVAYEHPPEPEPVHDEHQDALPESADSYEAQVPQIPDHEVAAAHEPAHPAAETDTDWLDQAFSAFDYDVSGQPPHPQRHPLAPAVEAPPEPAPHHPGQDEPVTAADDEPHEPMPDDHVAAEPELPSEADHAAATIARAEPHVAERERELEPAMATAAATHDLTVIGRYDSEGTSYVMYSDGSIEAQSEAGVYRFSSMAELKAFIEG